MTILFPFSWKHGKNGFAEKSKNLARYRSENNFVWIIKIIMYEEHSN